jgi:drug/metabolite transporter (DMT)-like permease
MIRTDRGPLLALASAMLLGASTPFAKIVLGAGVSPWLLAGLLYLGSGAGLLAYRLASGGRSASEAPLRRADLPWLALVVGFGGVLGPLLLMLGLATTPASSAALLLNLEGVATMAIAWVVFRENVDRRLLIGAAAIIAGSLALSWTGAAPVGLGGLAITGACLAWGIDNNLTRKLSATAWRLDNPSGPGRAPPRRGGLPPLQRVGGDPPDGRNRWAQSGVAPGA